MLQIVIYKKLNFWEEYTPLPRDPPPFMANTILNFHFDYLTTSLRQGKYKGKQKRK